MTYAVITTYDLDRVTGLAEWELSSADDMDTANELARILVDSDRVVSVMVLEVGRN